MPDEPDVGIVATGAGAGVGSGAGVGITSGTGAGDVSGGGEVVVVSVVPLVGAVLSSLLGEVVLDVPFVTQVPVNWQFTVAGNGGNTQPFTNPTVRPSAI